MKASAAPATPPRRAQPAGVVLRATPNWTQRKVAIVQTLMIFGLFAAWEFAVRAEWMSNFFWSKPSDIAATMLVFVRDGTALQDTWFTFRATVIGFVAGCALGALIGLSLWWSQNWARVWEPFIIVFNAIPKLALGPLIILMFGIGISSKIAMAIALTFVITALAAYAGVKSVDQDLVRLTYSLGGRRRDAFFKIVLPSAMPWIISSLRINIGLALAGVLIGEFISSQFGLGKVILYAGATYDIALIWAGIAILSALSMVLYGAVVWLERSVLRGLHATGQGGPHG